MRIEQNNRTPHPLHQLGGLRPYYLSLPLATLAALLVLLPSGQPVAFAGTVTFNYTSNSPNATISDSAVTATVVSAGSGVTTGISGNNLDTANWTTAAALDANDYVGFSITPAAGYTVNVTDFSFVSDRDQSGPSGQGPTAAAIQYSTSNFSSHTQSSTSPQPSGKAAQTLSAAVSLSGLTSANTAGFRIFGWSNNSAAVTWKLDDIVVTYNADSLASMNSALAATPAGRVMKNSANVRYQIDVTNDANTPVGSGNAAGFNYSLGLSDATGLSIAAPPSGAGLARNATANHFVDVDTTTTGVKGGGSVSVNGNNAWRANGNVGQTAVTHSLGSTTVVDNRAIAASAVALGNVLVGMNSATQTSNLTSPGSDNANTRVTVNGSASTAGGVTVAAASNVLFNGTTTNSNRSVHANFATSGEKSGSVNLSVSGEGLAGESVGSVAIGYTATAYDPASLTDNSGSTLDHGSSVSISNAAGSFRSAAFVDAVSISPGWSINNLNVGNAIAPGASASAATVTFDDTGLLNNYVATGTLSIALENDQTITGSAHQDMGTRNWNLAHTVSGQNGIQAAPIPTSGAYDNLSGASNKLLASIATLLGGSNSNGPATTVATTWRNRLPSGSGLLASDVVDLTGTAGDVFVLEMTYDENVLSSESLLASEGGLFLAWWDGSAWGNAVDGNTGANTTDSALLNFQGSWASSNSGLTLGAWGVDTISNVVWAVLDHNSEFSTLVEAVPEPSTILMLLVGGVLLLGSRRTMRCNRS